jgi:hypothetical protein
VTDWWFHRRLSDKSVTDYRLAGERVGTPVRSADQAGRRTTVNDTPHHDELPLPDYDHLPVGSLESRIRSLDAPGLELLLTYERVHGNRLPVLQVLENRLSAVQAGAEPTGGSPLAATPEVQHAPEPASHASPQTQGPPVNPPSHGDPTNPAQPRG